jgi:hypothetical protein
MSKLKNNCWSKNILTKMVTVPKKLSQLKKPLRNFTNIVEAYFYTTENKGISVRVSHSTTL